MKLQPHQIRVFTDSDLESIEHVYGLTIKVQELIGSNEKFHSKIKREVLWLLDLPKSLNISYAIQEYKSSNELYAIPFDCEDLTLEIS